MWTVDAQCSRCVEKEKCLDRKEIVTTLSSLSHKLNTEQEFVEGTGDGILICSCKDFKIA